MQLCSMTPISCYNLVLALITDFSDTKVEYECNVCQSEIKVIGSLRKYSVQHWIILARNIKSL